MFKELLQQFLTETTTKLDKHHQLVLLIHTFMIKNNFIQTEDEQTQLKEIKNMNSNFKFYYTKNNTKFNLTLKRQNNKLKLELTFNIKSTSIDLNVDNLLKNIKDIAMISDEEIKSLENYLNTIIDVNPNQQSNINYNNIPLNSNINNNFNPNPINNPYTFNEPPIYGGMNDIGPMPLRTGPFDNPFNFNPFPTGGNLVGPDSFNQPFGRNNINPMFRPHGARYDPITPFGINFDINNLNYNNNPDFGNGNNYI